MCLVFCTLQKGGKGIRFPKGGNQGGSEAGVSCYLCLQRKFSAWDGVLHSSAGAEEVVLFLSDLIQRSDISAITSLISSLPSQALITPPTSWTAGKMVTQIHCRLFLSPCFPRLFLLFRLFIHINLYFSLYFLEVLTLTLKGCHNFTKNNNEDKRQHQK